MKELICLIVFLVISAFLSISMLIAGFLCQYKNKTATKCTTYECGLTPFSNAQIKFDIRYFNYAILFLIFDVETIFLYPLAISLKLLNKFVVIEIYLFISILLFGLFFAVKKKYLRWL